MRTNLALGACALAAAGLMALRGGSRCLGESPNDPKSTARQRESVIAAANAASKLKGEREDKHRAKLILASEAARTDPETALTLARDLPPSPARDELIARAVAQWAASTPEDVAGWVEDHETGPCHDRLLATLVTVWGDSDPTAAARFALEKLPPGRMQDDALVGIVQRWTQSDPAASAAWVARFPEGPLRDASMENVTKLWTNQDPQAPGPWLKSIAAGTSRDNAIRAYAEQLAPSSPAAAAEWAATIDNPELREKQLSRIRELGNHGTIFE